MRITQLSADDWQKYRDITLESNLKEPQAFASTYASNLEKDETKWRSRLTSFTSDSESLTLFAVNENDEVVGKVAAILFKPDRIEVIGMYVKESERGKGIGKMLLTELLLQIEQVRNNRPIELEVNKEQEAAIRLYSKLGFITVSSSTMVLGDGKEYELYKMVLQQ